MKEVIVLSGKGGTGKTSLVGSFAHLAKSKVLLDCDVDASDLHMLLAPQVLAEHAFHSGHKAQVDSSKCSGCGVCDELCQFEAVTVHDTAEISAYNCEGCGVCAHFCPEEAIQLESNHCGTWYVSETAYGPFVHSQLFPGEDNSGKLVSHIKGKAREVAEEQGVELILIDGSPGVACPVIASLSGVDMALVVTEPSQSGVHDLERILDLTDHFKVATMLCINKWDLHPELSAEIETLAQTRNVELLGKIPFDPSVIDCQIEGIPVTVSQTSLAAYSIKDMWNKLAARIEQLPEKEQNISLGQMP